MCLRGAMSREPMDCLTVCGSWGVRVRVYATFPGESAYKPVSCAQAQQKAAGEKSPAAQLSDAELAAS